MDCRHFHACIGTHISMHLLSKASWVFKWWCVESTVTRSDFQHKLLQASMGYTGLFNMDRFRLKSCKSYKFKESVTFHKVKSSGKLQEFRDTFGFVTKSWEIRREISLCSFTQWGQFSVPSALLHSFPPTSSTAVWAGEWWGWWYFSSF